MKKTFPLLAAALCFSAAATLAQSFANPGLETWHSFTSTGISMETPDGWNNYDGMFATTLKVLEPAAIFKPMVSRETTIVHSGAAAARLETRLQDGTTPKLYFGILANGTMEYSSSSSFTKMKATGGVAVTQRVESVGAWLYCAPARPNDMGMLMAFAIKKGIASKGGDSIVGTGYLPQAATSGAWVRRDCFINYDDAGIVPDLIIVQAQSSAQFAGTVPTDSSLLYIDDLTLKAEVTGIKTPIFTGETINIYPNPATDVLHINTSVKTNTRFSIYSVTGRLIQQKELQGNTDIAINDLPAGTYIYQLHTQDGVTQLFQGSFIKK